ncbi:putative toxin-antitoxin system toxin component, PIN family [Methylomonas paludis]|uniref:Toxin-antitoxin system toxin component, PIN family n=1 Tax=Methylomonas paludis TaxID=1173101 RepID=A0A975MQI0_9GAMM|nr:putative toxin-antitoxin system toxin component, PIN family [Methylomonas paludis]QWF72132.1 putative toxin-antitoxin system toxin component, PIN family [Methylomonas paludis]
MIIVIDTNIFVGACMGVGAASDVIAACLRSDHLPLMGTALFAEYIDVINREGLFKKCHLDKDERNELLDIFLSCCRWTEIYYGWRPNLRDDGDNHLIELAVAGQAQCIVTRNIKDLQSGELLFPEILLLTPEEFLQRGKL